MTSDSLWEAERRVRFYAPKRTEGGKARQARKTKAGRAARPQPAPTRDLQLRSRQDGAHLTAPASTCPAFPRSAGPACGLPPLTPSLLPFTPSAAGAASPARRGSPLLRPSATRSPPRREGEPRRLPQHARTGPAPPAPAAPPPFSPPGYDRPKTAGGRGGAASRWRRTEARGLTAPPAPVGAGGRQERGCQTCPSPSQAREGPLPRQTRRAPGTSTWGLRHQRLTAPPTRVTSSPGPARAGAGRPPRTGWSRRPSRRRPRGAAGPAPLGLRRLRPSRPRSGTRLQGARGPEQRCVAGTCRAVQLLLP